MVLLMIFQLIIMQSKKKDILNIHNYLMKKHNMKMFRFIKHLFIVLFSFTGY